MALYNRSLNNVQQPKFMLNIGPWHYTIASVLGIVNFLPLKILVRGAITNSDSLITSFPHFQYQRPFNLGSFY